MSELGPDEIRGHLVQLRKRVGEHFDAAVGRTPAAFACREGCDQCCHARFGVFELEAAPIRERLARMSKEDPKLRARVRAQADDPAHADRCALLVDGRCSVYEERPLICRSQGLPLLVDERVDWCPLNFTDGSPPRESVLSLDALNAPLVALARAWSGAELARVELATLARDD
jgi:hypothetical protein